MFEIFWGILNITLLISFLVIVIKSIKLVRKNLGLPTALFLLIGLLFLFIPSSINNENDNFELAEVHQKIHENNLFKRIKLSENSVNKTYLNLSFSEKKELRNAKLSRTGLVAFTSLTPNVFVSDEISETKIKYFVVFSKNWYLMGLKVYTQTFDYQNEINL